MAYIDIVGFINSESDLDTDNKADMLEKYCQHHGYNETSIDSEGVEIPNPQSKRDFVNMMILRGIQSAVDVERNKEAHSVVVYTPLAIGVKPV